MRRILTACVLGAGVLVLSGVSLSLAQGQGGAFLPSLNYPITGFWNWVRTPSVAGIPEPFRIAGVTATGVTSRTVDLTNAQVLTLDDTAITMVPAPGASKIVDVIGVALFLDYTAAYTGGSDLRLWYTNRVTGPAASGVINASGLLTAVTRDSLVRVTGTPDNTTDMGLALNTPVVLQAVALTAFGGGNAANTLRVVVHYRIIQASGTVN